MKKKAKITPYIKDESIPLFTTAKYIHFPAKNICESRRTECMACLWGYGCGILEKNLQFQRSI